MAELYSFAFALPVDNIQTYMVSLIKVFKNGIKRHCLILGKQIGILFNKIC